MKNIPNKKLKRNKIVKIHDGMKFLFCRILDFDLKHTESSFRNHLYGQDILHVDVYDEDSVKDEKIGSVRIDLRDLYEKGSMRFFGKILFKDFLLGHIDQWFELTGKSTLHSHGQIHLILDYQPLKI